MDPVLIGYFPKRTIRRTNGAVWHCPVAEEVCNVACASPEPEGWVDSWLHNGMCVYDTELRAWAAATDTANLERLADQISKQPTTREEATRARFEQAMDRYIARHVVPPGEAVEPCDDRFQWDIYAYRMFPVRFADGNDEPFEFPELNVQPVPADYERLGFDPVSRSKGNLFEHSPLFCNGLYADVAVNRHFLLDNLDEAFRLARHWSISHYTPEGAYAGNAEPGPYHVIEVLCRRPK